jgi:hypothetical protein
MLYGQVPMVLFAYLYGKKRVPNGHTSIGRIHGVQTCLFDTLVRNVFSLCKVCQLGTRFLPSPIWLLDIARKRLKVHLPNHK